MLVPHPFDIVAILLGIFLALRKSEVRAEDPARHPRVGLSDFDHWRSRALFAYSIGTRTCFTRVIVDFGFLALLQRHPLDLSWSRGIGVSIDIITVLALITCWVFARRARRLADRVGIDLSSDSVPLDARPEGLGAGSSRLGAGSSRRGLMGLLAGRSRRPASPGCFWGSWSR